MCQSRRGKVDCWQTASKLIKLFWSKKKKNKKKTKKKPLRFFYLLYSFTFTRMSYNWHHAVYNLFQTSLFYLVTSIQISSVSFCDLIAHFFLILNSILSCWCTIVCLSIHQLKNTLVASNLCVCVCVCVWERERERVWIKLYETHVHVFVWALAFKSFG